MMKKSFKKIIVSIVAILLVVSIASTTHATSGNNLLDEINEMLQNENGNIAKNENVEQIPEGTNTNTNTNLATGNTNVNENKPATTPYAGVEDYTGLIFVAVFAVSAVYAYKKIRDYNA